MEGQRTHPQCEFPAMPENIRHLGGEPELSAAWEQQVTARRAEAAAITALLEYRARATVPYAQEPLVVRTEADRAAVRDAARILGVSDRTATTILNTTDDARHLLPRTWGAFCEGLIDLPRVRKTVDAATTSSLPNHLLKQLDQAAAEQAQRRSLSEFHHWLTRYTASLDPESYTGACEKETQARFVRFQHQSHGMSYLQAYIPTLEAAAIEKRLKAAARGLDQTSDPHSSDPPAEDPRTTDQRTLAQREADLLTAWLRDGRIYAAAVDAKIMIMIPEATLTGDSDEPAMAADRSWMIPAHQARNLAANPEANHHWYQGRSRKDSRNAEYDLLSARYIGRYPPAHLRDALIFRDGTCQADGCTISAERCDIDHQTPWEQGGETTASNLWALCRRHHRMKSHGFLHPPPQTKSANTGGGTGGGTGAGGGADTASHTRQRDGAGRNRDPYNAPRSGCSPGEYLSQPGQRTHRQRTHSPWEALLEENYSDSVPPADQQTFVSCAQAPSNQQGEGRSSPDLLWHSLAVTHGLAA
ncbi:HNH endonuclease signature motif containing protein [Nesterenkonia rhizosphaerae]|uniref:HNH nuclease domain-containing protein n=1 Tax=Nesterenkonia rhizosphaerae TaxID=1348272 RepID=A0ABP9G3M6_9MICC